MKAGRTESLHWYKIKTRGFTASEIEDPVKLYYRRPKCLNKNSYRNIDQPHRCCQSSLHISIKDFSFLKSHPFPFLDGFRDFRPINHLQELFMSIPYSTLESGATIIRRQDGIPRRIGAF